MQEQDNNLKQGNHTSSHRYVAHGLQRMYGSLIGLIIKQQQQKIHGRKIELVHAKNAVEYSGKGKRVQCMVSSCKCAYYRLSTLDMDTHGRNETLISSTKSVYDLVGMHNIRSTMNVQFINEPYNETAATQGPWHGDPVGSGKE